MRGRRISSADRLADTVRATIDRPLPHDQRTTLAQALDHYARATGYQDRLSRRQRRQRSLSAP